MPPSSDRHVALVTGGSRGIGEAICRRVAREGASVLVAARSLESCTRVAESIRASGGTAWPLRLDVSDPASARAAVDATVDRFGALDVLVNAAGILRTVHTHEETLEDWNRVLAINLTGTFLMCRAAIPHLLRSRGAIVNLSSTAALRAHAWTAAYSASKGGVLALTYELAIEYGQQGLRANAVCPGGISTPIHDAFKIPEGADAKLVSWVLERVDRNEYKRRQGPLVLRTSRKAFGSGRRLPIVHRYRGGGA